MNDKKVRVTELFDCTVPYLENLFDGCEYPWEMLPKLGKYIENLIKDGIKGFELLSDGVLVGKDVKIYENVTIEPPAIIGDGCVLRPGAFLRGNVVLGKNCVVGNSTELKNCVLLNRVQVPHYNYVGDSILGYKAHMGAGSITSNVKSDKKLVVVKDGTERIETGLKKFGAMLGDEVEVGCGSVLNPGTVIGPHSNIYPLSSVREVVPANSIYKKRGEVAEKH